ncbi:hypothetical protein Bbelb_166780, partial [Branchiostoma belcheri]
SERSTCQDNHDSCSYWAGIGECQNNPDYMLVNCRDSCDICHLDCETAGYVHFNGLCYQSFPQQKTRDGANQTCAADGGILAMPKDSATNTFLATLPHVVPGRWFGLTLLRDGQWVFEDGQNLTSSGYANWLPGEPYVANGPGGCVGFWGPGSSWDEKDCNVLRGFICQLNEVCDDGALSHPATRCDGRDDCGDNSDEKDCGEKQGRGEKSCANGQCISRGATDVDPDPVCDRKMDCSDGSDELYCPPSACDNGALFHPFARCDGRDDCGDNSDEKNCDCYYIQDKGTSYRGRANRGHSCQHWTSQYPHAHNHTPEAYPSAGLERNYCRNPDGKDRPWCYTNNTLVRWSYCDGIVACDAVPTTCFFTYDKGRSYAGDINRAGDRLCQRWDSQSPHIHPHTPQAHPDAGLEENFCRNPDNKERPWCYTTDATQRWDYCNVTECADPPPGSHTRRQAPCHVGVIQLTSTRRAYPHLLPRRLICTLTSPSTPSHMSGVVSSDVQTPHTPHFLLEVCDMNGTAPSPSDHQHQKWECLQGYYEGGSYWLVADCPDDWMDNVTRDQCLKQADPYNLGTLKLEFEPDLRQGRECTPHESPRNSPNHCPPASFYDPFVDSCRPFSSSVSHGSSNQTFPLQNCSRPILNFTSDEFQILPNGSVRLLSSNVSCPAEQVVILNTSASVCGDCLLEYFSKDARQATWDANKSWLTLGLVTVSVLAVTGFVFHTYRSGQWKKVPEKLKVQMMTCMAASEVLFVARGFIPVGPVCTAFAVLLHYSFLTAFSSMNVLAVDLFLTFRQESERAEPYKYVLYTWLVPVPIVLATVIVEFGSSVRVGYGEHCWIGNPTASLVAFGIPVLCALMINGVFTIFALLAIRKSFQIASTALERSEISKIWVYMRISFLTGFTWIFGFIFPFANSEVLEYIFIVLNASQGLVMTLMLTMTGEVVGKCKSAIMARLGLASAEQDNGRTATASHLQTTGGKTEVTSAGGTGSAIEMTIMADVEENRARHRHDKGRNATASNKPTTAGPGETDTAGNLQTLASGVGETASGTEVATDEIPMKTFVHVEENKARDKQSACASDRDENETSF